MKSLRLPPPSQPAPKERPSMLLIPNVMHAGDEALPRSPRAMRAGTPALRCFGSRHGLDSTLRDNGPALVGRAVLSAPPGVRGRPVARRRGEDTPPYHCQFLARCGSLLLLLCLFTLPALAQFTLERGTVSVGGAMFQQTGGLEISGTIGQPEAGTISGRGVTVQGGFWPAFQPGAVAPIPGLVADYGLALQRSVDPALVNTDFTIVLVITNHGPATATNLLVTNTLPPGLTLVSAASLRRIILAGGDRVICDVGRLDPGQWVEIELVVRAATPGFYLDTANAVAAQADGTPGDNTLAQTLTVASGPPRTFTWTGSSGDWASPSLWTPADGPPTFGDTAIVLNGTVQVSGTVGVRDVTFSGGNLSGGGTLTVGGRMTWVASYISGSGATTILPGAQLDVVGSAEKALDGRTLNNAGTATWTGTGRLVGRNGVVNNQAGALFDIQTDTNLVAAGTPLIWNNAGTLRKSATPGTTYFEVTMANTGTVEAQSGTLTVGTLNNQGLVRAAGGNVATAGSATSSGTFESVGANAVTLAGGTATLTEGARFIGTGTNVLNGGTLVTGNVGAERLRLTGGGTFSGSGTLRVTNVLEWQDTYMAGNGVTTIQPGGRLNLSGSVQKVLDGRTLNNFGTATWTGTGQFLGRDGVVNNQAGALFDIQTDAGLLSFGTPLVWNNVGTLRKSVATGTSSFSVTLNQSGTLELLSGVLSLSSYSPTAGSTLRFGIGGATAGTGFGRLSVSGTATLDGTLDLLLLNGFTPANGASFGLLTAGTRNGTFASVTGRSAGGGLFFRPNYTSGGVNVVVADGAPQFSQGAPGFANGQFRLRFGGAVGENYRVDVSTDLKTWTMLATTAMPPEGLLDIADAGSPGQPRRFYRVGFVP